MGIAVIRPSSARDRFGKLSDPPGLWDEGDVLGDVIATNVAGREYDVQMRPQAVSGLREFHPAHAGHSHVGEKHADLVVSPQDGESLITIVCVRSLVPQGGRWM